MKDEQIIIPLQKHTLILYPSEVQRLLLQDEDLYIKAIKRGKSEKRIRANEYRANRNIEEREEKEE